MNFFVAFVWKIEDTIISYWNFLNFTALASFEDNSVIENESANALTASIVKNETKVLVQFEVSKKYIFNAKKCLAQVCFTKNVNLWSFMFFDFFDTLFCMIFYWHNCWYYLQLIIKLISADICWMYHQIVSIEDNFIFINECTLFSSSIQTLNLEGSKIKNMHYFHLNL